MDRLSPFFAHFSLSAHVFFSGKLCGTSSDHVTRTAGHLHVLRSGELKILQPSGAPTVIKEPAVLFYPRPERHTFQADEADILCTFVEFGTGMMNPIVLSLPQLLVVPLVSIPELAPTIDLLFAEAFNLRDGRQAAVDRLAEYFLILLLRSAIASHHLQSGILLALSDEHLSKAFDAIHELPEKSWSLEELARIAGMSRARFAAHFRATTGQTPFQYLALWRIGVTQSLLKKGQPLKMIAPSVGFMSAEALIRSFTQYVGISPMAWLQHNRA